MRRTAQSIEEAKEARALDSQKEKSQTATPIEPTSPVDPSSPLYVYGPGKHPNSRKSLRPKPWPKGVSGNPGGKPGYDVAALIARRALQKDPNELVDAFFDALRKGNAYVFKELADRGFGKLKEMREITGSVEITERLKAGRKRVDANGKEK